MYTRLFYSYIFFLCAISLVAQSKETHIDKDIISLATISNVQSINTPHLEFAPTIYNDGMIYVASKPKGKKYDKDIEESFFELKYYDFSGADGITPFYEAGVNELFHYGPCAFDAKSQEIYYSENNKAIKGDDGRYHMKIVRAVYQSNNWDTRDDFPFNSYQYSNMHPAISEDGTTMIFASNMPGGYGKLDLYITKKEDGKWSDPMNMGPEINSSKNDFFPNFYQSEYLFYTSGVKGGFGGLDIYVCKLVDGSWQSVENLGEPINGRQDDMSLTMSDDGSFGFFSSNRKGGKGKDDIYRFELPQPIFFEEVDQADLSNIEQIEQTSPAVSNAPSKSSEPEKQVVKSNQEALSEQSEVPQPKELEQNSNQSKRISRSTSDAETKTQVDETSDELDLSSTSKKTKTSNTLNEVNREDESELRQKVELEKAILDIKSKSKQQDNRTSTKVGNGHKVIKEPSVEEGENHYGFFILDKFNNRPLIDAKVSIAPILISDELESKDDKIENLENNKRTGEITMKLTPKMEDLTQKRIFRTNDLGKAYLPLDKEKIYLIEVIKEGYEVEEILLDTEGILPETNILLQRKTNVAEQPMDLSSSIGDILVFENLYYEYNSSSIKRGGEKELDELVNYMQRNLTMEIELSSHTDAIGSAPSNLALSQKRADQAKQYLVDKGISPNRIQAKGYGEQVIRNHCIEGVICTDDEHAYNRRTELKILKK